MLPRSSLISRRLFSAKVGQRLESAEEISQLLNSPTWNVKELMKEDTNRFNTIDKALVQKLLQLSGLEVTSEDDLQLIISNLKEQVKFIDQLHSVEVTSTIPTPSLNRLTLSDIKTLIAEQKPDPTKGETESSWDPMSITRESKHGNYIVKEGLIKDNQ